MFREYYGAGDTGTVRLVYEDLGPIPEAIEVQEHYPTTCNGCNKEVDFRRDSDVVYTGKWYYRTDDRFDGDTTIPPTRYICGHPRAPVYSPLFNYLTSMENEA